MSAPAVHELVFGQSWLPEGEPAFQPATVRVWRAGDVLELEARVTDAFITDPPAEFNDYAYTQGDVFELFLKAEGDRGYHEIHVTPSNVLLQLKFEAGSTLPLNADNAKIAEKILQSSTERTADGWVARFSFPLETATPLRPIPRLWRIGCGRYDYRADGSKVLSNTAPLTLCNFHRYWEWPVVDLGEG